MSGRFTKTTAGATAEALTATEVYATAETFFQADPNNVDNVTIRDQVGNVALVLDPGRRDRVPVHTGAVVNPVTGTGDYHRLSQWTAQGVGAGEKVYVDAR